MPRFQLSRLFLEAPRSPFLNLQLPFARQMNLGQSELSMRLRPFGEEGRKEGRKEARKEGRKEGRKQGRKEGRKEGIGNRLI